MPPEPAAAMQALIAIPSQQHADQLAAALAERNMLARYYSGSRPRRSVRGTIGARFSLVPLHRLLAFAGRKLLDPVRHERLSYALYRSFDRMIARRVGRSTADIVIAYENCGLATLRAAKAAGKIAILDAADVHHSLQATGGPGIIGAAARARIDARKDAEIATADYLLCCSALAKDSYVAAGVPAARIFVANVGADTALFDMDRAPVPPGTPTRFLFAGRFSTKKGADLLLAAMRRLRDEGARFGFEIAADTDGADPTMVAGFREVATLHGKVPQARLRMLMNAADILLVPSRFDSFGMVVAEALACGTPALVSDLVGAKDFVREGETGFVVPASDADVLHARLAWCAANPDALRAMAPAAREAGLRADWSYYRARVADNIRAIVADAGAR